MTTKDIMNIFDNDSTIEADFDQKVKTAQDAVTALGTYSGDSVKEKATLSEAATTAIADAQQVIDDLYVKALEANEQGILHAYLADPYRPAVSIRYGKKGLEYNFSDMVNVSNKKVRAIYPLFSIIEKLDNKEAILSVFDTARKAIIGWAWKEMAEDSEKTAIRNNYKQNYGTDEPFTSEGRDKTEAKVQAVCDVMTPASFKATIKMVKKFIAIDHVLERKKNGEVIAIDRNTFVNRFAHLLHQYYTNTVELEVK